MRRFVGQTMAWLQCSDCTAGSVFFASATDSSIQRQTLFFFLGEDCSRGSRSLPRTESGRILSPFLS